MLDFGCSIIRMETASDSKPSNPPSLPNGQAVPTIPVICDNCRAEGSAGAEGFAEIEDILGFEPVPRRPQVNSWTPEHQRAFIAALAITGSAARAAASIGRHSRGVEKLLKAKGSREFGEAWEAALGIARDREMARLRVSMAELAWDHEAAAERFEPDASARFVASTAASAEPRPEPRWGSPEAIEEEERSYREYNEAQERIRERLLHARRLFLSIISKIPDGRAAWEVLVGEVDWDKAERREPQDNEPFRVEMCRPDVLLTIEAGLLADVVGGRDALAEAME